MKKFTGNVMMIQRFKSGLLAALILVGTATSCEPSTGELEANFQQLLRLRPFLKVALENEMVSYTAHHVKYNEEWMFLFEVIYHYEDKGVLFMGVYYLKETPQGIAFPTYEPVPRFAAYSLKDPVEELRSGIMMRKYRGVIMTEEEFARSLDPGNKEYRQYVAEAAEKTDKYLIYFSAHRDKFRRFQQEPVP